MENLEQTKKLDGLHQYGFMDKEITPDQLLVATRAIRLNSIQLKSQLDDQKTQTEKLAQQVMQQLQVKFEARRQQCELELGNITKLLNEQVKFQQDQVDRLRKQLTAKQMIAQPFNESLTQVQAENDELEALIKQEEEKFKQLTEALQKNVK